MNFARLSSLLVLFHVVFVACSDSDSPKTEVDSQFDAGQSGPGTDGDAAAGNSFPFAPSNLDSKTLSGAFEDVVLAGQCALDSGSGEAKCDGHVVKPSLSFVVQAQNGGDRLGVWRARSLRIGKGAVVTVTGPNAAVLVALDELAIEGGLYNNGKSRAAAGARVAGTGVGTSLGGGGFCGNGGNYFTGVGGGKAYGSETLIPLMGGSTGGSIDAKPGNGGGALQLVAGTKVHIEEGATVGAGGGGGAVGQGGGSGGGILIEAPMVELLGWLGANGGGGGGTSEGQPAQDDTGNRARGAIGAGAGGWRDTKDADAGENAGSGSGGGGGGVGRIRINTQSGDIVASRDGGGYLVRAFPTVASGCATLGTIAPLE
jgi:hypothetical protein